MIKEEQLYIMLYGELRVVDKEKEEEI